MAANFKMTKYLLVICCTFNPTNPLDLNSMDEHQEDNLSVKSSKSNLLWLAIPHTKAYVIQSTISPVSRRRVLVSKQHLIL